MSSQEARTRSVKKPEERRSELMAAAQALFTEQGYESTSIDQIVDRVGVAKGTFYYYFDSKDDVLAAIVDDMSLTIVGLLDGIADRSDLSAIEKWEQLVLVTNNWKLARRAELMAVARVMYNDANLVWRTKFTALAMERAAPAFGKVIAQGVDEGVFATDYPDESAALVLAMLQAANGKVAELLLFPDEHDDAEEIAKRYLDALHDGIQRTLAAEPGSLTIVDTDLIGPWFED
jgi:AcrR family transcriptional regulator